MTLSHPHDDFAAPAGESRLTWARASTWLAAALKTIHESIVAAKTRRLRRELMFHGDSGDKPFCGQEIGRVPQRPMILGDKWDF
jgi:hypothetical protein